VSRAPSVAVRGIDMMRATAAVIAILVSVAASAALGRDFKAGAIDISDPWSRATARGATVGAGYMKITNDGQATDKLLGGSADAGSGFELHESTVENGIAKMRPVKDGLEIKPGQTVEFKPGGHHVMFTGLKKPLSAGDHIKATLTFEKAGKVDIEYDVLAMGASPGHEMPGMNMPGMKH
jgi:copper(I)-binding protein